MERFYLSADFGKSNSKFAYLDLEGKPRVLLASPYIVRLESLGAAPPPLKAGDIPNIESSWVGDLDNYYVLGHLAQMSYGADQRLEQRKYEAGIYKLLGAIGYFSQIGMVTEGTTIDLALLLPFSEYRDSDLVWDLIRKALNSFIYCGLPKHFELGEHKAFPEGSGLYTRGLEESTNLSQLKVGVLMSGHQNQSWLRCDYGQVNDMGSYTNDLGFSQLVKLVAQAACIQERQWPLLTQQIFAADDFEPRLEKAKAKGEEKADALKESLFGSLLQAQDPRLRVRERDRLVNAVISCRRQYWGQVQDWLQRRASSVDLIVLGGGSAFYLRRELKKQWSKAMWGERLRRLAQELISFRDPFEMHLSLDVLGVLLLILPEEVERELFTTFSAQFILSSAHRQQQEICSE